MSAPLLTEDQVREIAKVYDGTTETIEGLIRQYGVRRHNIIKAAKCGGYKTTRKRIEWTPEKDQYLRYNWGKLPPQEVMAHLGCGMSALANRLKRIGHSTRHNEDFTVYDLEHLLKLDHRLWRRFIDDGWLKSYPEYGRNGEVWSRRVKVEWLTAFLRRHPEVVDYRAADKYARGVLELDRLPDPPRFMRLTCRSDSWKDGSKMTPTGFRIHHGEVELVEREHQYSLESCAAVGGTDFWAPLYANATCPRCGCIASRFSEKALFADEDPGEDDTLAAIAGKLGLVWRDGRFWTQAGAPVSEDELLRYVFSTKRNAGRAFLSFRRLLEAGISVAPPNPVPLHRFLSNVMDYELRDGQPRAFEAFLASGNVGVYWPPGQGKMYFLGMAFSRIAGEHVLFVHTRTIRDQWLAFFREHGQVRVAEVWKPYHHRVDILDAEGMIRSRVRIYGYATRHRFDHDRFTVAGFDEAQFLPGNNASRLATISSEYRVGLSATPFREDGRADLIQMMTGLALGEDWQEFRDAGLMPDVPVRVLIVRDLEEKHRALGRVLSRRKTIVFSDAIADGKRISSELGIPFIHAETKRRLDVLAGHRAVVMSRVGDCGIDVQDLEEVIEFNFHHGSRAQSLQRLGRLLHSRNPFRHTVMMTVKEFGLYHKRLSALEGKGFRIGIEMYRERVRRGRPPAAQPVSAWAQLLGFKPAPAKTAPIESQAEKRARVMRRIEERSGTRVAA
jgi:superfamily II DNA or RNA helicase